MHNGLPRCKAQLFPLVRGHLEFKKNTKTKPQSKCHISWCIDYSHSAEWGGKSRLSPRSSSPRSLCFRAEGQFLPSAGWRARSLPLLLAVAVPLRRQLSLVPKRLCTAGAWLIFPSSAEGERRHLLEQSEGQCLLSGSPPSLLEQTHVVKRMSVDTDETLFLHLRSFLSLKWSFSQWIIWNTLPESCVTKNWCL